MPETEKEIESTEEVSQVEVETMNKDGVPVSFANEMQKIRDSVEPGGIEEETEEELEEELEEETEEEETSSKSEKDSKAEADDEYEEIDLRLITAGRRRGWSDEKIIKIAETDESILSDLADSYDDQRRKPAEPVKAEPVKVEAKQKEEFSVVAFDKEKLKLFSDEYGSEVVSDVIEPLADKLNVAIATINRINANMDGFNEEKKVDILNKNIQTANEVFDSEVENFPVFGKTVDLSNDINHPAFKVRSEIYDTAEMFQQKQGGSFKRAMQQAMFWYLGQNSEGIAEKKIVKQLNARKTKFSPRPTNKAGKKRVFKTENERKIAEISEAKRKAGIES